MEIRLRFWFSPSREIISRPRPELRFWDSRWFLWRSGDLALNRFPVDPQDFPGFVDIFLRNSSTCRWYSTILQDLLETGTESSLLAVEADNWRFLRIAFAIPNFSSYSRNFAPRFRSNWRYSSSDRPLSRLSVNKSQWLLIIQSNICFNIPTRYAVVSVSFLNHTNGFFLNFPFSIRNFWQFFK